MSDDTPSKALALASAATLVLAAISGGAVTYASFTDAGNVAVTFSVGNVPEDPGPEFADDGTPTVETSSTGNETGGDANGDAETDQRSDEDSVDDPSPDGSTNETTTTDSATNETTTNDSTATESTTNETTTNETTTTDSATNETATTESTTNETTTTDTATNDTVTSDRTAAPIGAESTSRRGGREDASFRLGARRDGVSGDGER